MAARKQKQIPFWMGESNKRTRKIKPNHILQGDNLEIMKELEGNKIDLIYIDPPFCAQNVFKSKAWGKKVVSFNDEWGGGIQSYVRWLVPRLQQCHRLLKNTGSLFLHLDQKSAHYIKIELDKIFGPSNFRNEIIWSYRRWTATSDSFQRLHDTILWYSKSDKLKTFSPPKIVGKDVRSWKTNTVKKGNKRINQIIIYDKKETAKAFKEGRIKLKKSEFDNIVYKEKDSVTMGDVWEIDRLGPTAKERCGYPTQKPISLLSRIIESTTKKGDIVADFFCGCGTAVSAAQSLGRMWIGADVSKDAVNVIKKRMQRDHKLKVKVVDFGGQTRSQIYKLNPFDFERKMVELIGGTPNAKQVADGGVDGRLIDYTPIQVKKSDKVGRPVVDSFYKHVKNGNGKGVIIAKSFSKSAIEEVNKLYNQEGLTIDLVPCDDLIRDAS